MIAGQSVRDALARVRARLAAAGVDAAPLEARLLVAHALGCAPSTLYGGDLAPIDAGAVARLDALLTRRLRCEPIAYILGQREFWSRDFSVGPEVLIPRPDSETLVEAALRWNQPRANAPLRILDLGTGSGCLLLSVLVERPASRGLGVDRSLAALRCAGHNAERLGLAERASFLCADWATAIAARFDVILCNPPYIPEAEWAGLAPDVRDFEPVSALVGGADGLVAYRRIVPELARLLAAEGAAFFEVSPATAPHVSALANATGLAVRTHHDLAGRPRCLELTVTPERG